MQFANTRFFVFLLLVVSCTQAWRKHDCIVKPLGMKDFRDVRTLIEGGRAEEAIQKLKDVLQNPKDKKASGAWYYLLGRAYLGAQRFEDAVNALKQAKDYLPESNVVLNDLGVALFRAGYFEEACATLGAIHARFPNDLELTMNLLVAHAMCNLGTSALDRATQLAKKHVENFFVQYNTAFIAYTVKDYQTAQYHFSKALVLRPGDKQGLLGLLYACLGAHDLECAREKSKEAILRYPQDAHCLAGKAMILEAEHDIEGAVATLQKALSLDPSCALCYYNLGRMAEIKRNRGLAIQSYEQYLKLTGNKDTSVQQRVLLLRSY